MLRVLEGKRSWVTQRLANRFPPWSRLRQLAQSVGQQVLEPLGREAENSYWWANYNLGNYLLNTSDPNQLQRLRKLALPPSFDFRTREESDSVLYLTPTSVRAQLADESWVTLTQAADNSLEEFWYDPPDAITAAGESYTYAAVLPQRVVSALGTVTTNSPSVPGRLFVTLSNNGSSMKNYLHTIVRSSVEIRGRDIHGLEAKERIYFAYNGTVVTKLAWSEIEQVSTEYVDDSAFLQIDWLSVGQRTPMDNMGLHVTKDREKFRFFELGTGTYASTLRHMTFAASDFITVQEGSDEKEPLLEAELLDNNGAAIDNAVSLSLWPHRRWVTVTDGTNLHFFLPDLETPDLSVMKERTTEPVLQISVDNEWSFRGETITLDYLLKRPFVQVFRIRWSVLKPDGTKVGLNASGEEIAYSESGWVRNLSNINFGKSGFSGDPIEYTLPATGSYVFYLEATIDDRLTTKVDPIEQTDVWIVQAAGNAAIASVSIPVSAGTASSVGFDTYGQPWIINDSGVAHRLQFRYDKYLVDFISKLIYVREDYNFLEVTA